MNVTEDLCQKAEVFANSTNLTIIHYVHITLSSLALLALASNLPLSFLWHKCCRVHLNLKIILINLAILYALHSISFIIAQTYNQYLYRFYNHSDPCELLIVRWKCLSYRGFNHVVKIGLTFSQLGIVFERVYAALRPSKYEACSGKIGVSAIIITWLAIVFGMIYVFYDEDWDELVPYCILTNSRNGQRIVQEYLLLLGVDVLVTVIHIFITVYNRRQLQRRFEMLAVDSLHRAYHFHRNLQTMSVFLPLSAIHSFCFIVFLAAFTLVRQELQNDINRLYIIVEFFNTILCFYCLLMPTVFFIIRKKLNSKKIAIAPSTIQSEVYFKALERHWQYRAPSDEHQSFRRVTNMVMILRYISRQRVQSTNM